MIAGRALDASPNDMGFIAGNVLTLGTRRMPLDSTLRSYPRYFPPSGEHAIQQYPYWQVLSGGVPKGELRDKVVLIGLMNSTTVDESVATPVSKPASMQASNPRMVRLKTSLLPRRWSLVISRP